MYIIHQILQIVQKVIKNLIKTVSNSLTKNRAFFSEMVAFWKICGHEISKMVGK